jgi:1-acyl-sn-glycerol-3-phosphate acyltransferase
MKFLSALVLTPAYFALNIITLCVWDILLKLCWLLAPKQHKNLMDFGIGLLVFWLRLIGTKPQIQFDANISSGQSILFVSNHQSELDVPLLMWFLRRYHPLFVAKKELGRWFPSVSHTLRINGSVLIDRLNPAQAIPLLKELGVRIHERQVAACIFPEGTRSRNGELKRFKMAGALTIAEHAQGLLIVPVCIQGSADIFKSGLFPLPIGKRLLVRVLEPVNQYCREMPATEALNLCEERIRSCFKQS